MTAPCAVARSPSREPERPDTAPPRHRATRGGRGRASSAAPATLADSTGTVDGRCACGAVPAPRRPSRERTVPRCDAQAQRVEKPSCLPCDVNHVRWSRSDLEGLWTGAPGAPCRKKARIESGFRRRDMFAWPALPTELARRPRRPPRTIGTCRHIEDSIHVRRRRAVNGRLRIGHTHMAAEAQDALCGRRSAPRQDRTWGAPDRALKLCHGSPAGEPPNGPPWTTRPCRPWLARTQRPPIVDLLRCNPACPRASWRCTNLVEQRHRGG